MLRSLKDLEGYTVHATDGEIGTVVNFLLDDERWIVRYLIVQIGGVLTGRQVLISPISFRKVDGPDRSFYVALTMDKVLKSPEVDTEKPVSRQHESAYMGYYGYSFYWGYPGLWGMGAYPGTLETRRAADPSTPVGPPDDVHLRNAHEVCGYHVQGTDDAIGHVEDFIVDDEMWAVRYLVVDTSNWGFGKKVLVAPHWASRISWDESKVYLGLSRDAIKASPEWDAVAAIDRGYEARLHDHYGLRAYWGDGDPVASALPPDPKGSSTSSESTARRLGIDVGK